MTALLMVDPAAHFEPSNKAYFKNVWSAAENALRDAGFSVTTFSTAGPNSLLYPYPRDSYLMLNNAVFLPDVNSAGEDTSMETIDIVDNDQTQYKKYFENQGKNVVKTNGLWWEGGNFLQDIQKNTLFCASFFGEDEDALQIMQDYIDNNCTHAFTVKALPVKQTHMERLSAQISSGIYHGDLALSERLGPKGDTVLYCPEAFDEQGKEMLKSHFDQGELLAVSVEDAIRGAVNAVSHDDKVVTSYLSSSLRQALEDRNLQAIDPHDYGAESFMMANGGIHCLTNQL